MECDFCSDGNVVKKYRCMNFDAESRNVVLHSISYWAACDQCSRLVDEEDLDGLMGYVVTAFRARGYKVSTNTVHHLRLTYELFFKNRIREKEEVAAGE
jgi:hypothetical protein